MNLGRARLCKHKKFAVVKRDKNLTEDIFRRVGEKEGIVFSNHFLSGLPDSLELCGSAAVVFLK